MITENQQVARCIFTWQDGGEFPQQMIRGWDPVAAGNRAGAGMTCNNSDCGQWPRQEAIVGAAASGRGKKLLLGPRPARCERERSRCWVPQPVILRGKLPDGLPGKPLLSKFLHGYGFILPQDDRAISRAVRCPMLAGTGCARGNAVCKGLLYCPVHGAAQFPGAIG